MSVCIRVIAYKNNNFCLLNLYFIVILGIINLIRLFLIILKIEIKIKPIFRI